MRCIFCKKDSSGSKSIEHIIPESLGNKRHILPRGIVCDKCNNYIAREVEKPYLDSHGMTVFRFNEGLENKKGRIPPVDGVMFGQHKVRLRKKLNGRDKGSIDVPPEAFHRILNGEAVQVVFPTQGTPPDKKITARFLAKVGFEALASKMIGTDGGLEHIIESEDFDPIRKFVRESHPKEWYFHERRVYSEEDFTEVHGRKVQLLYEYDFLLTKKREIYFVLVLIGTEFVINIGGPYIDGYLEWMKENDSKCPLYLEGKQFEELS